MSEAGISTTAEESGSAASEGYLTELLQNARQALIESDTDFYLGLPGQQLEEKLSWVRVGYANRLVSEQAAVIASATCQAYNEEGREGSEPAPPEHAVLSVVIKVSEENYYLTACRKWNGPKEAAQRLADVKATCEAEAPTHAVFAGDFQTVMTNVKRLVDRSRTRGFTERKGLLVGGNKLKFRHILFEPKDGPEDETESDESTKISPESEDPPERFGITNWPVRSQLARDQLELMKDTHRANYLSAYDMHGRLIEPNEYTMRLQGALVQIHFMMTHWSIGGKFGKPACDTYVADIVQMRVLSPPASYGKPVTPRKRKMSKKDPRTADIAPKKFRTFAKASTSGQVTSTTNKKEKAEKKETAKRK